MGVSAAEFYDPTLVAILPMGFCYPGRGPSGDRPPRPECAPAWREALLAKLPSIEMLLLVSGYAQAYHLGAVGGSITERVQAWRDHAPRPWPHPHPSPRNQRWLSRHRWFERDVAPRLGREVRRVVAPGQP